MYPGTLGGVITNALNFRPEELATSYITSVIGQRLRKGEQVLWLVPGGSAIKVATGVSRQLQGSMNLSNLTVTLTDERYGPVGHAESNWKQLVAAGFDLRDSRLKPVLKGRGVEATTKNFDMLLSGELSADCYKFGLFGMGADGHTAGILPGSTAAKAKGLAAWYQSGELCRITMTPSAVQLLDEAILFATGKEKWPMLERLAKDIDISEQPAQILKKVPRLTIFSDFKGGNYENRL